MTNNNIFIFNILWLLHTISCIQLNIFIKLRIDIAIVLAAIVVILNDQVPLGFVCDKICAGHCLVFHSH